MAGLACRWAALRRGAERAVRKGRRGGSAAAPALNACQSAPWPCGPPAAVCPAGGGAWSRRSPASRRRHFPPHQPARADLSVPDDGIYAQTFPPNAKEQDHGEESAHLHTDSRFDGHPLSRRRAGEGPGPRRPVRGGEVLSRRLLTRGGARKRAPLRRHGWLRTSGADDRHPRQPDRERGRDRRRGGPRRRRETGPHRTLGHAGDGRAPQSHVLLSVHAARVADAVLGVRDSISGPGSPPCGRRGASPRTRTSP